MRANRALFLGLCLASAAFLSEGRSEAKKVASSHTKLLARAGEVAKDVAKLRGLAIKKPIERGVMNKAQIRKRITELLAKETSPEEILDESLMMKRFGLLPVKADLQEMVLDLFEEQIAGFYDQHEKKLYIASWTQADGDSVMAHEIDHALQDQHFDLMSFMDLGDDQGDAAAARQALVEGDGMALMIEFQMSTMGQPAPWGNPLIMGLLSSGMNAQTGAMKGVPLVLSESMVFPYVGGLHFIAETRKNQDWSAIDKMYAKPPLSTEHIIHPDKYASYEAPIEVTSAVPAALTGYVERKTGVQGEKAIEILLREHGVLLERAQRSAAGWGGDRMSVFTPPSHKGSIPTGSIGVFLSAWDDEEEAREFHETLDLAVTDMTGDQGKKQGKRRLYRTGSELSLVERRGAQVLWIVGVDSKTGPKPAELADQLWQSWAVKSQ